MEPMALCEVCDKPTAVGDGSFCGAAICQEMKSLRAENAELKDLYDFYFNHYVNCGGERRWIVDGPLGMQWRLTQKIYDKWEMIDGLGERKDFPTAEAAIRKALELAIRGGSWTAIDAAGERDAD